MARMIERLENILGLIWGFSRGHALKVNFSLVFCTFSKIKVINQQGMHMHESQSAAT